jgi:hypothetical protein
VLVFLASVPALRADRSLEQARRAQALLGPETWSRVIRIENDTSASRYPRTLHALVFELAGILWFYTEADGTQSFSLHPGRLAEEKADFAPLLRDIEPGFVRWRVVADNGRPLPPPAAPGALRNGCFIESVAELRLRLARGEDLERPQLLSYYANTPLGLHGHTVLVFGRGTQMEIFDPSRPLARSFVARELGPDALDLARALEGPAIVKARYVAIDWAAPVRDGVIATADSHGQTDAAKADRS